MCYGKLCHFFSRCRSGKNGNTIFQFLFTLTGGFPVCWRRIQIQEDTTFDALHEAIQFYFFWTRNKEHRFEFHNGDFVNIIIDGIKTVPGDMKLNQIFSAPGNVGRYYYFHHPDSHYYVEIVLEDLLSPFEIEENYPYPRFIGGRGMAPSEALMGNAHYYELGMNQ